MSPVILKHERLEEDEDITIEYKPTPNILNIVTQVIVPARRTAIVNKNEIIDDLGMEIEIDNETTELRSCYVALSKLSQVQLPDQLSVRTEFKTPSSRHVTARDLGDLSMKPFSCEFCPKSFARKSYLKTHRWMHTKEKTFQCKECPKKFITQNYLNKHFRASHFKPFTCVECPMKFKTESMMKKHKKTHSPFWTQTKTYECYICKADRHFRELWNLLHHMRSRHSSEKPYRCEHCSKAFAVQSYLTAHKLIHTMREKVHECNVCHKMFHKKSLAAHLKRHYASKRFQCEKCPKSFLHKHELSRHYRTNSCKRITHLPKGSILQCYICSKEKKTLFLLREHMLLFHLRNHSKRFFCDECPKKFTARVHLRFHKKAVHSNERPFACSLCSKTFNNKAYLAKHSLVHSKEKPFVCEICSKAFAHKSNLNRHIVIHVGERKFECDVCSKSFKYDATLKKHKRTHVTGIEFRCNECSKKYLSRDALRRHIKLTHGVSRPRLYTCELCEKAFKEKSILTAHLRAVHLKLKPFECTKCNWKVCFKKFRFKKCLDDHVKCHSYSDTKRKYFECYICRYICTSNDHLVIHFRKHTKEKPFSCDLCPHQCSTLSALTKHKIIHRSETLFACDQCPKSFKRSESLRSHKFAHEFGVRQSKKLWTKVSIEATE